MGWDIFDDKSRKSTPKADHVKIIERQKGKCAICGSKLGHHQYHIDHKKPMALGGSDTLRNKQALCPNCHHKKTQEDRKKIAKNKKKDFFDF